MLGDDPPVLADDDAVGVGVDVDRAPDRARAHRISVVVEPHEAGLRHRGRQRVESVEADAIRNELRALVLERLPDRLPALLGMGVRLGPDDTSVDEPAVQLVVALEPQPRCEEALAHQADLVLDLALLPARSRRAGDRLDEMVRAHLEEAAIVLAVLADEDRVHRRLHVVVDAALAGAPEEREGAVVGVEHHLLRLARVGAYEHHAAVAEPHVGDLHRRRHPADDDDLVAPVELVGFARRKRQGNVGFSRRARVLLAPAPRIAANSVVAALVAERPQLLVNADQRQPLARRRLGVRRQKPIERLRPRPEFRPRLDLTFIGKRRLPRPQDPPDRVARQMQGPRDLLDRLPLAQMLAPYPTDRLHNQHPPPPASRQSRQPTKPEIGGSILDADDAPQGVNFARRNTQLQPRARPTPAVAAIYRFPPTDSLSASTGVPEIWQRVLDELPNAKSLAMEVQNTQAIVKVGGFSEIKAKLLAACDAMDR